MTQHPADCDGSLTIPDAGFGGQDMTYECPDPSHLNVCGRCGRPAHKVTDATEFGRPVEIWHHDEVADDVFCGLVMHAADRLPR